MGGAEVQLIRMCKNLCKNRSDDVFLISLVGEADVELVSKIENIGVHYYSLGLNRGSATFGAYIKFVKYVKRIKPDIIHSHMIHANLLTRFSRPLLRGVRIINTIHGEEEYNGIRRQLYKLTDGLANCTVACGKILYDQAIAYGICNKKKLKYICNGLDTDEYVFDEIIRESIRSEYNLTNSFVWMTVARLSEVKNQRYLIREFSRVLDSQMNTKLVLVGEGPLKQELVNLTKDLHLENDILFLGQRDDVKHLLCAADAFVLSSVHEGLPLSMQEAGAVGMPLVSTDVGGCNEIIDEGVNGFLCESNRDNSLAEAMLRVMACDSEKINEMRKTSRTIVREKFDISTVMKQWRELYE